MVDCDDTLRKNDADGKERALGFNDSLLAPSPFYRAIKLRVSSGVRSRGFFNQERIKHKYQRWGTF